MSILFPKLNKPRQWDYRPIYYNPEKEARKEKLAKLQAERRQQEGGKSEPQSDYVPQLHRGSFREARDLNARVSDRARKGSKMAFWIALLVMLVLAFYVIL